MSDPVLDLTSLERDTMKANLIKMIPLLTPYWTDYSDTDPGIVILDLVSSVSDLYSWYLDKRVNELFIDRMVSKQSIIDYGKVLGYRLRRITAPTVEVTFSLKPLKVLTEDVIFPTNLVLSTASGVKYVTNSTKTYAISDTSMTMLAYQGILTTDTFTADGLETQSYRLSKKDVADNFLIVTIDGFTWYEDKFLPSTVISNNKFFVDVDSSGNVDISFNSFRYNVPTNGQVISVRYLSTKGPGGDVPINTVSTVTTLTGTDTWVRNYSKFNVNNLTSSYGSDVEEDYRQAKYKIPNYLSTLWRAVALADYESLAVLYAGVLSAKAKKDPNFRYGVLLYIVAASESGIDSLCLAVKAFLENYSVVGVEVTVLPASLVSIDISISITIFNNYKQSDVATAISDVISTYFLRTNRSTGETLSLSYFYSLIVNIAGVDKFNISKFCRNGSSGADHIVLLDSEFPVLGTYTPSLTGGY